MIIREEKKNQLFRFKILLMKGYHTGNFLVIGMAWTILA